MLYHFWDSYLNHELLRNSFFYLPVGRVLLDFSLLLNFADFIVIKEHTRCAANCHRALRLFHFYKVWSMLGNLLWVLEKCVFNFCWVKRFFYTYPLCHLSYVWWSSLLHLCLYARKFYEFLRDEFPNYKKYSLTILLYVCVCVWVLSYNLITAHENLTVFLRKQSLFCLLCKIIVSLEHTVKVVNGTWLRYFSFSGSLIFHTRIYSWYFIITTWIGLNVRRPFTYFGSFLHLWKPEEQFREHSSS